MRRSGLVFLWVIALTWCAPREYTYLDEVVKRAVEDVLREEETLMNRLNAGVDRRVPDFPDLAPPMLGAQPKSFVDSSWARSCKLINRIHYFTRSLHASSNITELLLTATARENNIEIPFERTNCNWKPTRYRSFDGRCNNRLYPTWGMALKPFARQIPPAYDPVIEGGKEVRVGHPRVTAVDGSPLPSARLISNVVHPPSDAPVGTITTTLYTNFGQSLSHDIADTPMEKGALGSKLGCCNQTEPTPRCFNIDIPEDDEFFHKFGRTCMSLMRSVESTDEDCDTGVREQVNIVSSFVDATQIYGHSEEHASFLRGDDGLLRSSDPDHLPFQAHPNAKALQHGINFFMAGDEKNGEFPGLVGVTTMLQREHNRIAKKITKIKNSRFRGPVSENDSDDTFFRTRKIVIALLQHVVYNEYLPVTLGPEYMVKYNLYPLERGYFGGYDPQQNPTVTNVVGAAAMRFGHSMIRNTFSVMDRHFITTEAVLRLKRIYWRDNFYLLFENGFQRGVLVDDSEKCDRHMSVDLKNHMFETKPGNGLDLAALNIQRGRDHGLPPYNEYRRLMGLPAATEWTTDPLTGFRDMTLEVVNKLKAVYCSPEDVDVWSGGISETPVPGGQVGPLFAELLGRQFQRLREGDFYWYENIANGFTLEQLSEIRKYSLAKMMCNNFRIDRIQPKAFLLSTVPGNEREPCENLPDINLYEWGL